MSPKRRVVIAILGTTLFFLAIGIMIAVALALLTSSQTIPSTGVISSS